jgi:hypothetical protein
MVEALLPLEDIETTRGKTSLAAFEISIYCGNEGIRGLRVIAFTNVFAVESAVTCAICGQQEEQHSKIGHPTLASYDCLILESSIKHRGQISSCDGQALRLSTPFVMELELCNPCAWYGKTFLGL